MELEEVATEEAEGMEAMALEVLVVVNMETSRIHSIQEVEVDQSLFLAVPEEVSSISIATTFLLVQELVSHFILQLQYSRNQCRWRIL